MAIQHVSIKNGSRGSGGKHARYVAGEGRYGDRDDVVYFEDGNLPKWAPNAEEFFSAADELERGDYTKKLKTIDGIKYEKHIKGRSYKEVEAAIPRESKDPVQWAKDYARDLLGNQHPYRLAVHDKAAGGGGRNAHIHLMFSTRTMDGHDRTKEDFFKRAASAYRHPKTKELVQRDPASGGAGKSKYWNSRESIDKTREKFEHHVQRVVPDFKMERSDTPEPKMGPALKNASKEYKDKREERTAGVANLRSLKMVREIIDSEIKLECERERLAEKSLSKIDGLLAKGEPGNELKDQRMQRKDTPGWSKYRGLLEYKDRNKLRPLEDQSSRPNWSRFKRLAGTDNDNSGGNEMSSELRKNLESSEQSGPGIDLDFF